VRDQVDALPQQKREQSKILLYRMEELVRGDH
jgi:hypothetical protein